MEFWGIEVKPGVSVKIAPGYRQLFHIAQASLGEVKDLKSVNNVLLRLKIDGKDMVFGSLSGEERPQIRCDLVFQKEFELSHGSKNASVYFLGHIADDPSKFSEMPDSDEETVSLPEETKAEQKTEAAKKPDTKSEKVIPEAADEDESDDDDDEDSEGDEDSDDSGDDDMESSDEEADSGDDSMESSDEDDDSGDDSMESSDEEEEAVPQPTKMRPAESPRFICSPFRGSKTQ